MGGLLSDFVQQVVVYFQRGVAFALAAVDLGGLMAYTALGPACIRVGAAAVPLEFPVFPE